MKSATTASDLQPITDLADKYKHVPMHLRNMRFFFARGDLLNASASALSLPQDVREQLPQFVLDSLSLGE